MGKFAAEVLAFPLKTVEPESDKLTPPGTAAFII
jgi:hypothetical protein